MKLKLCIKNEEGKVIEEKIYKSISEIARTLDTTYCSVQFNYLMNIGERVNKKPKRAQLLFNKKYDIIHID